MPLTLVHGRNLIGGPRHGNTLSSSIVYCPLGVAGERCLLAAQAG